MTITATEFKKNLGKYLDLALREDIIISKNGKECVVLKRKNSSSFEYLDGLLKDCVYDDSDVNQNNLKWGRLKVTIDPQELIYKINN